MAMGWRTTRGLPVTSLSASPDYALVASEWATRSSNAAGVFTFLQAERRCDGGEGVMRGLSLQATGPRAGLRVHLRTRTRTCKPSLRGRNTARLCRS